MSTTENVEVPRTSGEVCPDTYPDVPCWGTELMYPEGIRPDGSAKSASVEMYMGEKPTRVLIDGIPVNRETEPRVLARVLRDASNAASADYQKARGEIARLEARTGDSLIDRASDTELIYLKSLRDTAVRAEISLNNTALVEEWKAPSRPTTGLLGRITQSLGGLSHVNPPEYGEFKRPRGYRIAAAGLLISLLIGMQVMWALVPSASGSAVTAAAGDEAAGVLYFGINTLIGVIVVIALARGGWGAIDRFMFRAALKEEIWFRLNSENWTRGQRVKSCVGFGFAHVLNILLMAASLGVLILAGAAFTAVYLRQVKKTGDQRQALYVAARFHADYNMTIVGLVLFAFSMNLMALVLSLVVQGV